ncbi:hypothetical protein BCR44DRAFT_1438169 [Catenaria anguillulae PL171]|uniref:Phospholipid-transporting ATPase n=1 Tax=Catenaria anguillulae PL171 TaxID=765915 RepID=A0A1Y2HG65_9FUNG|nr:hypothetical protein BCR44DRAFT_1438169 [Catenaria anguillulae PL171]
MASKDSTNVRRVPSLTSTSASNPTSHSASTGPATVGAADPNHSQHQRLSSALSNSLVSANSSSTPAFPGATAPMSTEFSANTAGLSSSSSPRKQSTVVVASNSSMPLAHTPPPASGPTTMPATSVHSGGLSASQPGMAGATSASTSVISLHRNATYQVDFNRPDSNLHTEYHYPTNYIRTAKYTLLSFLPLNLFGQFRRLSNLYFLLGAIFSMVIPNSTVSPFAQVAPLLFVLSVTALKDGHEDYQRHKADQQANRKPCYIVKNGQRLEVQTQDLTPRSHDDGLCYIETSELDGETSLKRRNALPETSHFTDLKSLSEVSGRIQCELPNENLNKFEGRLVTDTVPGSPTPGGGSSNHERVLPLTMSQLLLRGSFLRNTDFAYGVVVYAGVETKIFKNLKRTGLKYSTMEKTLNKIIFCAFIYNLVILFVSLFLEVPATKKLESSYWYLPPEKANQDYGFNMYFSSFMNYFILYSYTIPVSLFVIIEAVRVCQRQFMLWDQDFKCPKGRTIHVNNSNLNEDLGAIHHVFSDKTGTLTRNEMILTYLCTGPAVFKIQSIRSFHDCPRLARVARCILLCNGAMPIEPTAEVLKKNELSPGTFYPALIDYESQSPDEIALLRGVRAHGVIKQRKKTSIVIQELGKDLEFELLNVLEFNSDRKRMSVIVREPDGTIVVYSKGADNIMFQRLAPDHDGNEPEQLQSLKEQIHSFSEEGLRTLVFTAKVMSEADYADFKRKYDEAARSLVDRDARLDATMDTVELGLELLGCSAIEDRLQDKVPETIEFLLKCGIKVWMLTGDKQETAVNIAHSARLFRHDMQLLRLDGTNIKEVKEQVATHMTTIVNALPSQQFALTVTGEALAILFETAPDEFLRLCTRSASVICCRVTPLQKALVVRMVKQRLGVLTLSIGDGANDVSMIQEADVGVGIEGMEGAQAVRAADYAFVEFKNLARLLSVHGRYSMLRLSNLVFYSFYKNISFISTQFYFGNENAWSGQALYNGSFLPNWNVLFTSIPPLIYACMEKDVPERTLTRFPQLYQVTRDSGSMWGWRNVFSWFMSCVWHTIVSAAACLLVFNDGPADQANGTSSDLDTMQWFNAIVILAIVTFRIMLMSKHWTWFVVGGIVLSFLAYVAILGGLEVLTVINESVLGSRAQNDLPVGLTSDVHGVPSYWFLIMLGPAAAVVPDWIMTYLKVQDFPSDADILREDGILEERAAAAAGPSVSARGSIGTKPRTQSLLRSTDPSHSSVVGTNAMNSVATKSGVVTDRFSQEQGSDPPPIVGADKPSNSASGPRAAPGPAP